MGPTGSIDGKTVIAPADLAATTSPQIAGHGRLSITLSGQPERPLRLACNGMSSTAEHLHFEVVKVPSDKLELFEQTKLLFVTNVDGDVEAVQTRMGRTCRRLRSNVSRPTNWSASPAAASPSKALATAT